MEIYGKHICIINIDNNGNIWQSSYLVIIINGKIWYNVRPPSDVSWLPKAPVTIVICVPYTNGNDGNIWQ